MSTNTGPTRARHGPLGLFALAVYLFLYAPILVLVVFSFNKGRLTAVWEGATLHWYWKLLDNPQVLTSLRNSLVVGFAATAACVVLGTAAALAFHRHRFARQGALDALITLPIVVPEIVLASSLVLLFASVGLRLGFLTIIVAHVAFSVSYAVVVVRARLAGFDRSLEEAAMDLGAGPWRTFFLVTLPGIAPGVLAAALLVFSLSIDDYVITSFVAGVGSTTLPIQIYSMVKSGISPEINAISTLLLLATSLLLYAAHELEQGRGPRRAALPVALGLGILAAPFALGRGAGGEGQRVLNLYIWSNYIAPETIQKFEARLGVRVNVDLYDTNEALLAKIQGGNVAYDLLVPSNYPIQILLSQDALLPLDHSALPNLRNADPALLDRDYDRGNRYSVPYFWGTCGIAFRKSKVGRVDSWGELWNPRYTGRVLMLDDSRETIGAALKWKGRSYNTVDPGPLDEAKRLLILQKPLVRTYDSGNFHDVLLSGDVWIAQGWNGQFAKVMAHEPDIDYVIPREGGSLFIDSLVIPRTAPNPALAHAFIDFTLEPEIAAEICRTMRYSSPNRAALPLLPPEVRGNPAIFPPQEVMARLELIEDLKEATVLYDRIWTEVKTAR
jgi:spermidine/putrescine transport system permease protein